MGCVLDKYAKLEVKEVVHDSTTGKYHVELVHAPSTCPDGALNSAKILVKTNADVRGPVLSFSTVLNSPVVSLPPGVEVKEFKDPSLIKQNSGLGFWGWTGILLVAGIGYYLYRSYKKKKVDTEPPKAQTPPDNPKLTPPPPTVDEQAGTHAPTQSVEKPSPVTVPSAPAPNQAAPQQPVAYHNHTTIVQQHSGLTAMDVLQTSLLVNAVTQPRSERVVYEREVIHEIDVDRLTPVAAPSVKEPEPETYSSDKDDEEEESKSSSYSSDSSSSDSYSSDDSSSYSSDSSSSDSYSSDND